MSRTIRLAELLEGLAQVRAADDRAVTGLTGDSRAVKPGDLVIARSGQTFDATAFIPQAEAAGAVAVIYPPQTQLEEAPGIPAYAVEDIALAQCVLADRFYDEPSRDLRVVGITGTNGKTSVSQFVAQSLSRSGARAGVVGTLGYGCWGDLADTTHTTPDVLELQRMLAEFRDAGCGYAVLEVSSHALEQQRLGNTRVETAVFTNLSHDHLDYHGDMDSYALAKRKLFQRPDLRSAVVNMDDPVGRRLIEELVLEGELAVWAFGQGEIPWQARDVARVHARHVELDAEGLRMEVETPEGTVAVRSPLMGRFNVSNLLATAAVLLDLGMPLDEVAERLGQVEQPAGRMERFGGDGRPVVVVDYAHTPDALEAVLHALRPHCRGELWCVFGCGGDRDRSKRPRMGSVAAELADRVVITDDNPRFEDGECIVEAILGGMEDTTRAEVIRDRSEAIRRAIEQAKVDDIVLVAGKGHEDYQEVGGERRPFSDRAVVRQTLGEGRS